MEVLSLRACGLEFLLNLVCCVVLSCAVHCRVYVLTNGLCVAVQMVAMLALTIALMGVSMVRQGDSQPLRTDSMELREVSLIGMLRAHTMQHKHSFTHIHMLCPHIPIIHTRKCSHSHTRTRTLSNGI